MIKEFIQQIPNNSKIVIYGAGTCGKKLKRDIEKFRPDIKILYFLDSVKTGVEEGIEIVSPKEVDIIKDKFDLLVFAVRHEVYDLVQIAEYLNIPYIVMSNSIDQYYRLEKYMLPQKETASIFKFEEDRELYNLVWNARVTKNTDKTKNYALKHNIDAEFCKRNYNIQYLEHINKQAIRTVFDGGFYNGINALSFKHNFPNLETIYAFEPMYDKFRNNIYDKFIQEGNFCQIVNYGLWDKETELDFAEDISDGSASKVISGNIPAGDKHSITTIKTTTIDHFKQKNNISKIDFIKMDMEGAEFPALKGGIKALESDRPQLAISIYHSHEDFINIPIWLNNLLKNYTLRLGHYSNNINETVLYAIPNELYNYTSK